MEYRVGQQVHGFARGFFGRDSYRCRRIEYVGPDYVVTRNTAGVPALILTEHLDRIDLNDRSYCFESCDGSP